MKQYSINQTYTAKNKQQIFNVEKPFISDSISVFVNGILKTFGKDKDYLTVQDTGRIIFNSPLNAGDEVNVISVAQSDRLSIEVISSGKSDKPTALYKKYGTAKRLKFNNKYEVKIMIDKVPVQWNFVSKYNPMFTTSKKIYDDIGEFIEGFNEEYVSGMIYRNGMEVISLIDELASREEPIKNVTYEKDEDGNYTTKHKAVKDWVLYKTEIDLIYARYFGISYKYGKVEKRIGDISIAKETKLPYIDNLLARLKDLFKEADNKIKGLNVVASGVKAIIKYKYKDWERKTKF